MQVEEHQPESVATGSGTVGIDDTALIERVEPSSFGAEGDRMLVHVSSPKISACPGDNCDIHTRF